MSPFSPKVALNRLKLHNILTKFSLSRLKLRRPEKLFITKAVYQLNKYNKAWLNPGAEYKFSQNSSRNCLKYSEKRIASIQGNFYLHLHPYPSLAKTWLSNRISPGLKVFHIIHCLCSQCSFVFFLNRLTANERHWNEPRFWRPFYAMIWHTV